MSGVTRTYGRTTALDRLSLTVARGARVWGLHNYRDSNPRRGQRYGGTKLLLRTVRGKVWLTETGGIVKLGSHRPYNPRRAAKAIRHMFVLGRRFKRIKRIYIYNWTGGDRTYRFDSGLTNIRGGPRPAYRVVLGLLARLVAHFLVAEAEGMGLVVLGEAARPPGREAARTAAPAPRRDLGRRRLRDREVRVDPADRAQLRRRRTSPHRSPVHA